MGNYGKRSAALAADFPAWLTGSSRQAGLALLLHELGPMAPFIHEVCLTH